MRPAWSVILLTTLLGAAQGLFLVAFLLDATRRPPDGFIVLACLASVALAALGLVASFFHLGRPERAWRTASQWRTSWLSREVIALPAFLALAALYGATVYAGVDKPATLWVGAAAALACLALFLCTAMVYACLKFLQGWHTPLTLVNFVLLGLASGAMLSVPLAVIGWPQFAGPLALAAFALGGLAWLVRLATFVRNARLRPKSTTASAIGPRAAGAPGPTRQLAQGFMGGSFNTREFFHGQARWVLVLARLAFLVLAFPLPGWLLGWGGGGLGVYVAAFVLQFAGLLAERWLFFADARHPQNLYYQAAS